MAFKVTPLAWIIALQGRKATGWLWRGSEAENNLHGQLPLKPIPTSAFFIGRQKWKKNKRLAGHPEPPDSLLYLPEPVFPPRISRED